MGNQAITYSTSAPVGITRANVELAMTNCLYAAMRATIFTVLEAVCKSVLNLASKCNSSIPAHTCRHHRSSFGVETREMKTLDVTMNSDQLISKVATNRCLVNAKFILNKFIKARLRNLILVDHKIQGYCPSYC